MAEMERFTQKARRVLSLAHQEAEQSRNNNIGTEHLLLGLMQVEGGVSARVLLELGIMPDQVREVIRRVTTSSSSFDPNRVEIAVETQQVLEYAVDEARRLGHHYIGTEHILLGLIRVDSTATEVLRQLGVTAEQIRRQTLRVFNEKTPNPSSPPPPASAPSSAVKEAVSVEETHPVFLPPVAGYITDRINEEAPDLLNIEREVANIANVLTFKQVRPPLALGLFGDWGSGKSFFIGKLRRYIGELATHYRREEEKSSAESLWCSRVAQIEFNAWHFSDSNLWASLVTRIYEGLDRELNREKETADEIKKKIIESQIQEAKEKSLKASTQLELATERVSTAEKNLEQKRKNREGKENQLLEMIGSLPDLLDDQSQQQIDHAAKSLGVPEAAKTLDALESLNGELQGISGRTKAVFSSLLYSPLALVIMALFIVIIPILVNIAIDQWGGRMTEVSRRVAEISTFLFCIIGWLQSQVRRGIGLVTQVGQALEKAQAIRQRKIEESEPVKYAREELTLAKAEEQAAHANLEVAKTDLQRLQDELQELRPERKLQRLIETRANTGAYAQHLGIISHIRSDFETMSNILTAMANDPERDFQKAPPIQRIILYIDDLDRCKPERVVEVLEAIHLLLFFPLFVVVVAVDPRWLRHSLAQHYSATLQENGGGISFDDRARISLYSTPQEYLEKIFQIPFALRPVEKGGYQGLINELLKPLSALERPSRTAQDAGQTSTTAELSGSNTDFSQLIRKEMEGDEGAFQPIPPRQLEFTKWEQEDIQQLWLMFRTPRTVKRFINIYRLLRAGLISESEVKSFEGTSAKPGEYQVALLLLATVTAFPNESYQLLYRLDTWLDAREMDNQQSATWQDVIKFLSAGKYSERDVMNQNTSGQNKSEHGELPKEAEKDRGLNQAENVQLSEGSWNFMLDCLNRVIQNDTWNNSFALTTLRTWILRVARFSFSVQPT